MIEERRELVRRVGSSSTVAVAARRVCRAQLAPRGLAFAPRAGVACCVRARGGWKAEDLEEDGVSRPRRALLRRSPHDGREAPRRKHGARGGEGEFCDQRRVRGVREPSHKIDVRRKPGSAREQGEGLMHSSPPSEPAHGSILTQYVRPNALSRSDASPWPSGLRRQTQVLLSKDAWVRTPLVTYGQCNDSTMTYGTKRNGTLRFLLTYESRTFFI